MGILKASIDLNQRSFAISSDDGKYRYWLHRTWIFGRGFVVFVMLNPSTADGLQNDPTVRRCIGFAQREGAHGVGIVNLFAARSTEPDELLKMDDPVGPDNDKHLLNVSKFARYVICGWGAHEIAKSRGRIVARMLRAQGVRTMCLGKTKHGFPQHPLYIASDKELEEFGG